MKRFCSLFLIVAAALPAQDPTPSTVPPLDPSDVTVTPLAPVRRTRSGETVLSPRIRDITKLANSMPHYLTGVGLVTGLPGTGSSDRGTRQAMLNFIKQHDLNLAIGDVIGGSTALVSVTCALPPFAKVGQQLDVKAEVLGDAVSLRGGELVRAVLKGVDGLEYVVVQGSALAAGFSAQGQSSSVSKNPSAVAWFENAGLVIREENTSFYSESGALELLLINPSPFNAASVAGGITTALAGMKARVSAVDGTMVRIELPEDQRKAENAVHVLNLIGGVRVAVENPARVLIDQVSGTVLAGEGVLISPCVVGLTELTIAIAEEDFVSQPNQFGQGTSERINRTRIEARQESTDLQEVGGGATVADLLQNLKALQMTPEQLVRVFQALDQGGFLHASLEVR